MELLLRLLNCDHVEARDGSAMQATQCQSRLGSHRTQPATSPSAPELADVPSRDEEVVVGLLRDLPGELAAQSR